MSLFEYRSFRYFNKDQFLMDLQEVDFSYVYSARADENAAFDKLNIKFIKLWTGMFQISMLIRGEWKLPCMNSNMKKTFSF